MEIASNVPTLESLKGLWTRSLIAWPDGARDTTTQVWWLQGPGLYCDLRQPEGICSFDGVHCLAEVTPTQLEWMARQDAFAGELSFDGVCFEWKRGIDLQPRATHADRGRLQFEADVLIEHGEHIAYVEHWHRQPSPVERFAAARLTDEEGRQGYLVRVDQFFMYARGHEREMPSGTTLLECVQAAPSHEAAMRLLDCEVALGRIGPAEWVIEHSSLPFRKGQRFDLRALGSSTLTVSDSDFHLGTRERRWQIAELRGPITDLLPDSQSRRFPDRSLSWQDDSSSRY